jgi:hypothetical protein
MKRFFIISILAVIAAAGTTIMAQDQPDEYLGLPGDNFNLYAVMKLFQESETLESFERSLNDDNSRINNLDLNGDNFIDYIKVIDYVDGNVHTIVLRAVLGRNESQDVAVFTVQKFRDGSVQIQLTGDEILYGRNYIIEPIYEETPNPGYTASSNWYNGPMVRTTYFEVAAWPLVRFIFLPGYVAWYPSWYWGYYPDYWHPWRPYYWHFYYGYHYHWYSHYYAHYHPWNHHRYAHWNDYYYHGKRVCSHSVSMRINTGHYNATYSHPEQRKDGEAMYARRHPERASSLSSGNNQGRRSDSQMTASRKSEGASNSTSRRSTSTLNDNSRKNPSTDQNTGTARRSTTPVNDRARTNSSSGQNTGSVSRSNATVSNKVRSNSSSNQNTGNVSRSSSTGNDRARTSSSSHQNTGNVSRSNTTVNDRARINSSSSQNTGNVSRSNTSANNRAGTKYTAQQNTDYNRRSSEAVNSRPVSKSESVTRTESARPSRQPSASVSSSSHRSSESSKPKSASKKSNDTKDPKTGNTSRRK